MACERRLRTCRKGLMVIVRHVSRIDGRGLSVEGPVALVGNSDLLRSGNAGPEIDRFATVFRFNLACTSGYESAVGTKTSFYLFSRNISTRLYPHPEPQQAMFESICRQYPVICYPNETANVRKFNPLPWEMKITVEETNSVFRRCLGNLPVSFSNRNHPRNGIKMLACLLDAGVRPCLYGFDTEDRGRNAHYFDDEVQVESRTHGHKPSWEFILLRELAALGWVEIR
jgi:hypothetical protein